MSAPPCSECFRGLRGSDWKKEGDIITAEAFMPDERTEQSRARDGRLPPGCETSVNWADDDEALPVTLADKTNAKYGAARCYAKLALDQMEQIDKRLAICCERATLPNNKYHGNFVFPPARPKYEYRALAGRLATAARPVNDE